MKTKLNFQFLITITLFVSLTNSINAAEKIDAHRVFNPEHNSCIESFRGKISQINYTQLKSNLNEIKMAEQAVLDWIDGSNSPVYLKDFEKSKFHWQFVDHKKGDENRMGVIVILPINSIREDFYTELGGGLEIPGTRCYGVEWSWLNDGEILSFVIDKDDYSVEEFVNWRVEQEHPDFDPILAYYSELVINYKNIPEGNRAKLFHFVDGELRAEIPVQEGVKVLFPKGKMSTLVFYLDNSIKGVMCFDMSQIRAVCPMYYESTVYFKEKLGYERVLYTQPLCEGIYAWSIIGKPEFEKLTSLKWSTLLEWNELVTSK